MPRAPSGAGAFEGVVARGVLLAVALATAAAGFADTSESDVCRMAV